MLHCTSLHASSIAKISHWNMPKDLKVLLILCTMNPALFIIMCSKVYHQKLRKFHEQKRNKLMQAPNLTIIKTFTKTKKFKFPSNNV